MDNKTIYCTYKQDVPDKVFKRWEKLNPTYTIDFSKDNQCISFLEQHFNPYIVQLFKTIPQGMFKADLWRLCKLYVHGGVYADVDLVPYCNIDELIGTKKITFYSCLAVDKSSVFQAFMINNTPPRNPLILCFLISFLINKPYKIIENGPTIDMYDCIKYNIGATQVLPEIKYMLNVVKIKIPIPPSLNGTMRIPLHYFPTDLKFTISHTPVRQGETFQFAIHDEYLYVKRATDIPIGWLYEHHCDICIQSTEIIYLFTEHMPVPKSLPSCYVSNNNKKILDCRDIDYYNNKGWTTDAN